MRKILFIIPFFLWTCGGGSKSPTEPSNVAIPAVQNLSIEIEEDTPTVIELPKTNNSASGLTYSISTDSQYGSVSIVNGNATYTPNENYFGTDSFVFSISNGETTSSLATVSITITSVNDAPVVQDINFTLGESNEIVLLGEDVEDDNLTFSIVSNPLYGTISLSENKVSYTGYPPTDNFTYKANDGYIDSNIGIVNLIAPENEYDERIIKHRYPNSSSSRSEGNQIAYRVSELDDGSFILVGASNDGTSNSEPYFVHVDNTLNQISEYNYNSSGPGGGTFQTVTKTNDGGFIVGGYTDIPLNGDWNKIGLVIKFDMSGNEEWSQTYFNYETWNGWKGWFLHGLVQTDDDGYVLSFRVYRDNDNTSNTHDIVIMKIDSEGNEEWSNYVNYDDQYAEPRFIYKTSDGGYLIASWTGLNFSYFTKLSSDGTQEWNQTLNSFSSVTRMEEASSGGYVITGENGEGPVRHYFAKIDENANLEFSFPHYPYISHEESGLDIHDAIEVSDGYIFLGNVIVNPDEANPDWDIYIFKTDFNFVRKWSLTYGDSEDETDLAIAYFLTSTNDGNYVAIGESWPNGYNGNRDIGFILINPDGDEFE